MGANMAKILIIEDNPEIRGATKEILVEEGHDVMVAESAEKGLDTIQDDLDLMIFDVVLPGMSGWDLCEQIKAKEHLRDIPVIMITSKVMKKHQLKSKVCGAARHINKPFKYQDLIGAVNDLLE
jgi:CheY-like chemotaxis protein